MGYMKPLVLISGLLALNSVGALSIKSILGKESLTDLIIPQDWSDAFKTVADILDALKDAIDDEQEQKFPLALNLSLLHIYHRHLQDRYSRALIVTKDAKTPEQELEFATNALRYMHFSSAAYGALMGTLIGVMEGPGLGPEALKSEAYSDRAALRRKLGLADGALRVTDRLHHRRQLAAGPVPLPTIVARDVFEPRYFVAADERTRSVVLAIKGTASAADLAKDLMCHAEPWLGGEAHSGIRRAAERVFEEAMGEVAQALKEHPGYKLVLCGHSMGGGTAMLLWLLLRREAAAGRLPWDPGQVAVECWAYAPPPVFRGPPPPAAPAAPAGTTDSGGGGGGDGSPRHPAEKGGGGGGAAGGEGKGPATAKKKNKKRRKVEEGAEEEGEPDPWRGLHVFVHHHDLVPRLSLGSVYRLLCELRAIDQLPLPTRERLEIVGAELAYELAGKGEKQGKKLQHTIALVGRAAEGCPAVRIEDGNLIKFDQLEQYGAVYHLYKQPGVPRRRRRRRWRRRAATVVAGGSGEGEEEEEPLRHRYSLVPAAASFFLPLRIHADMFLNHVPSAYERALEEIVAAKQLKVDHSQKMREYKAQKEKEELSNISTTGC